MRDPSGGPAIPGIRASAPAGGRAYPPRAMESAPEPPPGLIAAVRAGEAEALDRWYRGEHPRVWKLCLGFLADRAEADDVAQEAMLHLFDRLDDWDPGRPWSAWRNTVVLNLCRDRVRRRAARRRAEDRAAEAGFPDRLPDPARAAEGGEVAEVLRAALAELTPREREAFVLRELEGLATGEVAAQLGVGESTVRSLLTLARRRLRGLLAPRLGIAEGGDA